MSSIENPLQLLPSYRIGTLNPEERTNLLDNFDIQIKLTRSALRNFKELLPGEDLADPLDEALSALPQHENCLPVLEQFYETIQLAGRLPRRVYLYLLAEAGIARLLYGEKNPDITYVRDGSRQILVSKNYPAKDFPAMVLEDEKNALDFIMRKPPSGTFGLLDFYVSGDETERNKQWAAIGEILGKTDLLFLTKEEFYRAIPGGDLLRRIYGDSFWVHDFPLTNCLLYTDDAAGPLSQNKALLRSNLIHELGGHPVIAHTFGFYLNHLYRDVRLDPNLVLPDWFKEGVSNLNALRFFMNFEGRNNFLDLFLENWDGRIPTAGELISGDTQVPYFFYSLFNAFALQTLMQQREKSDTAGLRLIEFAGLEIYKGLSLIRQMSLENGLVIPDTEAEAPMVAADITQDMLELWFNKAAAFLSLNHPDDYARPVSFEEMCILFDFQRESYMRQIITRFGTTRQKEAAGLILQSAAAQKTNLSVLGFEINKTVGGHDPELVKELIKAQSALSEGPLLHRQLAGQIETARQLAPWLPEATFQRLLSEVEMVGMITPPVDGWELILYQIEEQWRLSNSLFRNHWYAAHPDVRLRIADRGVNVETLLGSGEPLTGRIIFDEDFNQDIIAGILKRHFEGLISAQSHLFTDENFPYSFEGRKSHLELFAQASGLKPEDLFSHSKNINFIFRATGTYYDRLPLLGKTDHAMFWVREHPFTNTLLYTERAEPLIGYALGHSHILHEFIHLLLDKTLPIKVRLPGRKTVLTPNFGLLQRAWFQEGLPNILAWRFMDNYREQPDFWHLTSQSLGDDIRLPHAADIVAAGTAMPYLFHTVFSAGILQMLGESFTSDENMGFPDRPSRPMMWKGFFLLLASAQDMPPIDLPADSNQDLGQIYFEQLLKHTAKKHYLVLPAFADLCAMFDQGKDKYWQSWQEVYKPT